MEKSLKRKVVAVDVKVKLKPIIFNNKERGESKIKNFPGNKDGLFAETF